MTKYKTQWESKGWRLLFIEALATMCSGNKPSLLMVDRWLAFDDDELQQWCIEYATYQWMTGIGIIDAAQFLVEEVYGNANIDEFGNLN